MNFKNMFSKPRRDEMQSSDATQEGQRLTVPDILKLLEADATSISKYNTKYVSLLTEYQKKDPNRLKHFPTYLTYTLSSNKDLLNQQSEALKTKESAIEHSLKLHSKYQQELAHTKLPQEIPSPQKLMRMKEEIGEARLAIKEEMDKLEAVSRNISESSTEQEGQSH